MGGSASIRLFGPTRFNVDGTHVALGGPLLRGLLAYLALHRGRDVHAHELVDALWGDAIDHDPNPSLRVYVSNLRRELDRVRPGARTLLAGRFPLFSVDPVVGLDVADVEGLQAVAAMNWLDHPTRSLDALTDAEALVRGEPLVDVLHLPFAAYTHRGCRRWSMR